MTAVTPQFVDGPITCDVAVAVVGGQFVEATAPAHGAAQFPCQPAGAGSVLALGVALIDAQPGDTTPPAGIVVYGLPISTVVANQGIVPGVTYAASATYGARLKCAAAGAVTPWVAGTDNAAQIVGTCVEPAGVSSAAKGRVRLTGIA